MISDDRFEPADRPVRWQESLLCLVTQLLTFLATWTHSPVAQTVAYVSILALMGLSLWLLLAPPRFSATRCAFIMCGLFCLVLLLEPAVRTALSLTPPHALAA
jgi:hypothetical protein